MTSDGQTLLEPMLAHLRIARPVSALERSVAMYKVPYFATSLKSNLTPKRSSATRTDSIWNVSTVV